MIGVPKILLFALCFLSASAFNAYAEEERISSAQNPGAAGPRMPHVSKIITGDYMTRDNNKVINFSHDGTFSYRNEDDENLKDGIYEHSPCAVTARGARKVLNQGNFIFTYNRITCCYDVKLVAKKLLVLEKVWGREEIDKISCVTTIYRHASRE